MTSINRKVLEWALTEDTGLSSIAMAAHLMGMASDGSYPLDGSDLGRCLKLLEKAPELRERLYEMAGLNQYWAALVARWDELERVARESPMDVYQLLRDIYQPIRCRELSLENLPSIVSVRFGR